MKDLSCKNWIELDYEYIGTIEICKANHKKCTCSGVRSQCDFPNLFKPIVIKFEGKNENIHTGN